MKVMQVLPELTSGGVEQVTIGLAEHLVAQGHQSIVVSNGGKLVPGLTENGSTHLQREVHKKSLLSLRHVPALRNLLRAEQPDILHLRSRAPAWLFYLAWKGLPPTERPRLVTTVHGLYSVNRYSRIMTRGEVVICVSQAVKQYVLQNYPDASPDCLEICYEGISREDFSSEFRPAESWKEKWYQEFPQTAGKRLIALPGRLTRLKGHHTFLKLIATLRSNNPQVHGLIVGGAHPKKEGYLDELRKEVQAQGLAESITFTGKRSDLREVLSLADLSLSLSEKPESFGLTILEALALGTPVIAYDEGGASEILAKLCPAGAIPRDDFAALVERAGNFLHSPPEIAPNNDFLADTSHRKTEKIYQDLLHSPRR
ncbi:glycosyltransferase [Roseibacillus persicicus]|uniref:Glycosyl transferase n=1 Tax=Roseibacillus persicicus TaxID=454148 RepID=A0A918TDY4_9BACT|nr:glycosyltransferase [Roseibacillus persicicus]GHC40397.1 glycosyl transferase [Roseibacillus persicicus]